MANTDRFKDIDAKQLEEYLKGVSKTADRDLVDSLNDIDKKAFSDVIKDVENLNKSFKDIQQSKKRKMGFLSDINRKKTEREQAKATKRVISGMEKAITKKMRQESIKRTFTLSKGKKILSHRSEKEALKANMEYTKELIDKYMKQGMSADSKQIMSLKSVLVDAENRLNAVNSEIFNLKGGEKYRSIEIDKLNATAQEILKDITAKQRAQEDLTKEKTSQIEELISEGFDEQSEAVKQLQKQLTEASKSMDEEVKALQEKLDKTNKEVGYLSNRADPDNLLSKMMRRFGMGKGGLPDVDIDADKKKGKGAPKSSGKGKWWNKIPKGAVGFLARYAPTSLLAYVGYKAGESAYNQPAVQEYVDSKSGTPDRNNILYRPKDNTPIGSSVRIIGSQYGVDPELLRQTMSAESGGRNVKNPNSSASGVFQMTDPTWIYMIRHHGRELGVNPIGMSDAQILSLKNSRDLQMKSGALFTKLNLSAYKKQTGYDATWADAYVMHLLGGGLGIAMINAVHNTPHMSAKKIVYANVSKKMGDNIIKYNLPFFEKGGKDLSALGFYSVVLARMGKNGTRMASQATYGKGSGAPIDMVSAVKTGNLTVTPLRDPMSQAMTNSIQQMGYPPMGVQEEDMYAESEKIQIDNIGTTRRKTIVDQMQETYGLDGVEQNVDMYKKRYETTTKIKNNAIKIKRKIQASLEKKREIDKKSADVSASKQASAVTDSNIDKKSTPVVANVDVNPTKTQRNPEIKHIIERS